MYCIESHAHLHHDRFKNMRDEIIDKMLENRVSKMVEVPITYESNFQLRKLMQKYQEKVEIGYAVGIHPLKTVGLQATGEKFQEFIHLTKNMENTVAIGETGLDFYRENNNVNRHNQLEWLWLFACVSKRTGDKPLILHLRGDGAPEEALDILKQIARKEGKFNGVIHSCTIVDWEIIEAFRDLGFHMGISGATLREERALEAILNVIPWEERLLLETDSPYLHPSGKGLNDPSNIPVIAEIVSKKIGCSAQQLMQETTRNSNNLFWPDCLEQ